uniref:Mlh1_C domain-containing protein n=1 Tax=Macrostomum lignano TaxID=282301 RepID=A0A1I8IA52_9PLAT
APAQGRQHQGRQHQGRQHQGRQHRGASTRGASTRGASTRGASTRGPAPGAPAPGAPAPGAPAPGRQHQGRQHQGRSTRGASTRGASTSTGAPAPGRQHQGRQHQGASQGASTRGASTRGRQHQGRQHQGRQHQGASTRGASTRGASTRGASTRGASTRGASTRGASTGAPAPGGASTRAPAPGAPAPGASTRGASTRAPAPGAPAPRLCDKRPCLTVIVNDGDLVDLLRSQSGQLLVFLQRQLHKERLVGLPLVVVDDLHVHSLLGLVRFKYDRLFQWHVIFILRSRSVHRFGFDYYALLDVAIATDGQSGSLVPTATLVEVNSTTDSRPFSVRASCLAFRCGSDEAPSPAPSISASLPCSFSGSCTCSLWPPIICLVALMRYQALECGMPSLNFFKASRRTSSSANSEKVAVTQNTMNCLIRLPSSLTEQMHTAVMINRLKAALPTMVPGPSSPASKPVADDLNDGEQDLRGRMRELAFWQRKVPPLQLDMVLLDYALFFGDQHHLLAICEDRDISTIPGLQLQSIKPIRSLWITWSPAVEFLIGWGALHGLGANKGRATGSVRGAGVSQQTVDITPSSRLTSPVGCLQREQQHLLHRLWAVRLGADEMACELESPTAHAAIECRVGDSLDADVEGGAQQTSVRRIDLLFETKGSPGKPAAASQVLASVWNQTAEVDELLTSREFGRLPVSASAKYCSLDVVRHAEHNGLLRVDHQADTRRNGNQPVQLPLGALDGRGQQGEVVGVAKHAEPLLRQMPRWSSSLVVPGFFGTATMCAVVHSLGAASPKSTRFITLATSAATQGMRSASMGTSSGPSAFPPGDCWASLTTSAALTGATLKLSSAGSGVSGGSVRLSGSGGGGALTMAAKNSRSSFLRSSGVSPARFSGLRRFRPSVDGGPGHAPSGIGPSGRDSLNGVIDSRLLALQVDSCQSCLCLAGWSPAQAELLQIFPRCLNRGVVLPDRLPTLSRLHHRDCLLRGGSDCSAHFRILGTSTLVAQRGVKGASKATLRIGGSERAVVAPRWPLRRTVERIAKVEVADEEPVIGPQSQRRDGAAVDGATTLTETHEHVVELCLSPGCVPATRVPSPPLAAHEGCETAQWLAEAGVGRHHVLPLQEVLQCLGVVVPAWRHEQRPLGPTQDCVQVSEGDRCPDVDPKQPGGQGDAATALLQPRPDQRSNSSTASLVRRSIVEGPPGAQVLTMKSRVGLDRHLLQRDDVAAQVVRQLRQHPSTPSSLESAAVQRPDPKHALWYGWGSMQLSLTVPGATRRIRVDPRGSSTGGATQPASSVPLTPALNTPTGAPLPSLGPAAFGRRSNRYSHLLEEGKALSPLVVLGVGVALMQFFLDGADQVLQRAGIVLGFLLLFIGVVTVHLGPSFHSRILLLATSVVPGNDSGSCSVYSIAKDALDYLENYLIERFSVLCESPLPATAMEAEDRLVQLFASCNLHSDSVRDMRELAVRKKRKAAIALFECVHRVLPRTADESVCLFTALVMEHVVCEIMRLSITYMKKIKIYELKKVDIKIVCQLFKQPLVELNSSSPDIDTVFSAISQVSECSGLLFVALDDSRNVTDKPPIGHCFYELAEEGNFDSFAKYAQDILNPRCTERLLSLLSNRAVQKKYESLGRTVEQRCLSRLAATALQSQNHRRRQQHQQLPQHYLFSSLDLVSVSAASGGTASSPRDATSGAAIDQPDVGDEPTQPPPPLSASSGETRNCLLLACRYLLPSLLLVPIGHFLYYDRILAHFEQLRDQQISDSSDPVDATSSSTMIGSLGSSEDASSAEDRDAIKQCRSILVSTRHKIDTVLLELERSLTAVGGTESAATDGWCRPLSPLASRLFFHNSVRSPDADHPDRHCAKKLDQLRQATKSAAEIDARPKCCVFYRDASLWHLEQRGGRFRERRVCLFNNRLFVLKACSKTLALRGSGEEFKLKRVVHLTQYRFCVLDLAADAAAAADGAAAGTDDELHTFAIEYLAPAESGDSAGLAAPTRQRAVFGTKSAAEKDDWMLILVYLQCYHMFEDYLFHGVNSKPEEVCFPIDAHGYEFLQPDSDAVLELEENSEYSSSSDSHVIRRATLNKLVEKMTQGPGGIDNRLMPVFLMTYRSFCTPQHLMEKLIARFSIPDYSYADFQTSPDMPMSQAQSRKREFENAYCRRVRLRVLKVMNTWVSEYFHDFVLCPELVGRMREFLCGPLVERHYDIKKFQAPSLLKNLERRFKGESPSQETPSPADCPEVLWHTTSDPQDFNLMSLHPLELARQITLYMFSLYQRIQPWELVTGDWMKTNEKQRKAPNVHALIRYTNRLTWWCCSNILSTPNLEERRYVLLRVYEIMRHFRDLNNFLGLAALDSVFVNSSVQYIRLQHTWKLIKNGRENSFLQQMQELVSNSNNLAKYDELLRSLSSACVPNLRYHLSCIFRILEINRARQKESPESLQLLCD